MKGYHEGRRVNKFFMGLISIVLCFSIIGASTMTAFAATPVEAANDTAPKLQFMGVDSVASDELCLIVFEDMEQNGADSEGRAIIGGDLTIVGSWSASVKQPYPSEYVLMVGGNIIDGGINAGGCVAIGGGNYSDASINVSGYCSHSNSGDAVHVDTSGWINNYISQAEQAFTAASAQYAALPADGTAFKGGWDQQWYIVANPDHVAGEPHVFHLDLTNVWSKTLSELHFYGDFGNDAIIINVNGGTVNFTSGGGVMIKSTESSVWNSETYQNVTLAGCPNTMDQLQSNIIWNCYEAEEIKISAYAIQGSLLAPYANVTGDNGHVNGTTVVKSMVGAGGFEYHTGHFFKNPFSAALEVSKVVEGTPDSAAANEEFSFQLQKADGTVVETFTLGNGDTWRYSALEENVTYKVVELASSEYYTFDRAEATGSVSSISGKTVTFTATDGSSRDITFYNDAVETEKEGSITVKKNLSDSVDSGAKFTFTVYDSSWQAVGTATLGNGESKTFSGLPLGSYTVTETVDGNVYTTTVEATGDSGATVASTKEVVLSDNALDKTVTFTNTRNYGAIDVTKYVNGTDAKDNFTFRLYKYENNKWVSAGANDITVTAGASASFNGLPYGVTYAVAELSSANYSFASVVGGTNESLTIDGYPAVKVTVGSNASVAFTNTLKSANLTVSKTVSGTGNSTDTFSFTLQKKNGSTWTTVETFTLRAGDKKSFTGLAANTSYRIYESSLGDIYERGGITGADSVEESIYAIVNLQADESRTVSFTNVVKPGSITVKKVLNDSYDNAQSSFAFTLYEGSDDGKSWNAVETFTLKANESKTFNDLDTEKTYKVVESEYANYSTTIKIGSASVNGTDTGAFTISPNADTAVTYTNNRKTADITVRKAINGTPFSSNDSFTFRLYKTLDGGVRWVSAGYDDITVKANGTAKFEDLPYGVTYAVAEIGNEEYTFTSVTGGTAVTIVGNYAVYDTIDGDVTFTFTNTPIPKLGGFTVTKTVSGYGIAGDTFTFKVEKKNGNSWTSVETFTLKAGESKTFSDLTAGDTYRISETSIPDSYELVSVTGANSVSGNVATVTIADKACPTVVFTNEVKTGSIKVTKTLNDKYDNAASSFSFTAYESADGKTWTAIETFTLAGGASKTISDLDVTKYYKVVEADYSATYETTVKVNSKTSAALDSGSFTLTADKATEIAFTNTRKTASITVKKAMDGQAYDGDSFTFRLYKQSGSKWVEAGVADITVQPNGSATFSDLAYGNTYAVVELAEEEYTLVSVTGANVTINGLTGSKFTINGDAEVTFTNRPIPRLGGFTVTKQLTGGNASDEFGFTVQKKEGSSWVEFDSFTLRAGDSKIYTDLVEGEIYRIYESETGAIYELASITGADTVEGERYAVVTIVEDGNPTVAFVNKVKQGTITVQKTLIDEALTGSSTFRFELQKLNGSAYETIEIKELSVGHGAAATVTFENLPYNETYRVVELDAAGYETTSTFEGNVLSGKTSAGIALNGAETVEFKNVKKVTLSVAKKIAEGDTDLGKTFTFVIQRKVGSEWTTIDTVTLMASDAPAEFEVETGTYRVLEIAGTEGYTYAGTSVTGGVSGISETSAVIDGANCNGAQFVLSANGAATIENRTVKGNIILSKIVTDTVTPDKEFTFTLQQLVNGSWQDVLKSDGAPVTVVLKHSEAVDLNQVATLEYGSVYRVVETVDSTIYETTIVTDGVHSTGNASGSVTIGSDAASIAFTNTRRNAQLKIVKALTAESSDLGESFEISVYKYTEADGWKLLTAADDGVDGTFTLKAGANNARYISLPVGATYKVVETKTGSSYTFDSYSDNVSANSTITLMSDAEVVVYNAIKTGSITVSKTLNDDITPDAVFTFNVTDANGKLVASKSITGGESFTVENLPYGSVYTVTEVVNSEVYETTVTANGKTEDAASASVTIGSSAASVEFENTRREGDVVIRKCLSEGSNEFDEEFSFTLYRLSEEGWTALDSFTLGFNDTYKTSLQIGAQYGIVETATGESYEFDTTVSGITYGQVVVDGVNNTGVLFTLGTEGQTVNVYNKNKTAEISVNKAVIGGEINSDEFTFVLQQKVGASYVDVSSVTIRGGEKAVFTENSKYSFYLGNEYRIVEKNLGARYELAEIVGADSADVAKLTGEFVLEGNRNVTFVNSVKQGSLSVRKILADEYDSKASFTVIVRNADTGATLASGTLGGGDTLTVENIPYGTKVEVTEVYNNALYTAEVTGVDANNIVEIGSESAVVTFTNTRNTHSLTVGKALPEGGEELQKTFSMKLQMYKNGAWNDVEDFTLKAEETKTFNGLFAGVTYRVIETDTTESFAYSSWTDGTAIFMEPDINGATFQMNGDKNITINNTLKTASLTIGKTVALGGEWEEGESFTFVIEKYENGAWTEFETVTLTYEDRTWTSSELAVGEKYRVTETNIGYRYELDKIDGADKADLTAKSAEVIIDETGNTLLFTNKVKTGVVIVKKALTDALDSDAEFTFVATNVKTGETIATFTLGNGGSYEIADLPYGTEVEIRELGAENYNTTVDDAEFTVNAASKTVTFNNVRKTASLTVDKALAAGSNDLGEGFEFELQVLDGSKWVKVQTFTLAAGEDKTIDGLFVGASYRLIETETGASYNFVGMSAGNPISGADGVEFVLGGNTEITATNVSRSASLTIEKIVNGNAYDDTFTFTVEKKSGNDWKAVKTVTLGGDNGMSYIFTNLTVGDIYRVTETNLASRYTLTKIEGATSSSLTDGSAQVTIGNSGNTVTYTNTVKTGSVVIEKALNDAFDSDATFTFTAYNKTSGQSLGSKELGNGEKWTIEGLEYGDVIAVEELSTGALYTTTATGLENGTVTVNAPSASVVFTNVRNTGSLTVSKTVDAGAALGKSFSFALEVEKDGAWTAVETFTLKAGEEKTLTGLYVGASYRVVETDTTDAYTFVTATGGEVAAIEAGAAVSFVAAADNAVEFVNSLKTAKLTITKTIAAGGEWVEGEKFTFIVERFENGEWVEFDTAVVTYDDRTWTSEKEVRVGDQFRVTETEIGYRYQISEIIGGENTDLTAHSAEVIVPVEGSTLVFVNEVKQGSLTVSKTLVDTVDPDAEFAFTLYKYNASTETYDVADSFTLGNGDSKTFEDLLYGDLYKVVEQAGGTLYETTYTVGDGSAVKSTEASVTIANPATAVAFNNARATAKLTVDKALLNGATDEEFSFVLEKKLASGEWQTVESFTLTAAAEPKAFNLEVETEYRITETVADGSSFEFANAQGVADGYVNGSSYYFTLKTNSDVVFENQLRSAGLTVRKIAANAVDTDVFGFTLYKMDGSNAVAVETFELKANEYKTFQGLLYGEKYIVKETAPGERFVLGSIDGADTAVLDEAYGLVEINGSESMTFTNIIKTGKFTVKKTLTDNTDPDAEFTFEVYRNGSYVDSFKLTAGGEKTIESNSAYSVNFGDVFEIREIGAENYSTTVTIDGAAAGDAKLTVTKDSHSIGFDNVRRKATLTVAKAIKDGDNLFADSFTFTLEQKLGDEWKQIGEAFTLSITPDAPAASADFELDVNGIYRVTETATGENYVFDSVVNAAAVSGKSAGILTLADDTTVTFVNTVKSGTVSVTKTLTDGYDPDAVFAFTAYNAETGDVIATFSLAADQTWVSPELPYGTVVKVVEAENDNYIVTTAGLTDEGTVTVLKANTDVSFRNVRKSANLTVEKVVEDGAELSKEFKFVLQMKHDGEWINIVSVNLKAGENKVFEELYYGVEYRVIETDTSDSFDFVKVEGGTPVLVTTGDVKGNGAAVTLTSDKTLVFENELKGAQLKLTKDVEELGDWLDSEVFTFNIEKQNADGTWTLVKEGIALTNKNKIFTMDAIVSDVYRITETSDNYRYYLASVNGADSADLDIKQATVTITPSGADVLFTNDVYEGNIVVSKVWEDKYDMKRAFTFNVYKNGAADPIDTITLAGGESAVIETNDKYTVKYGDIFQIVETTGTDYTTSIKVDGTSSKDAKVVIIDSSVSVEFTNERATASLTVRKTLENSKDLGEIFEFELYEKTPEGNWNILETFELKAGLTKVFDGLSIGVEYKVVETKTGSYNFLNATAKGSEYSVSTEDNAVTLTLQGNTTVIVSNVIKKASLTVNKTVEGADYGDTFTFDIEKKNDNGGWTLVKEGVSISAAEKYTWYTEASVGDVYRVTETTTGDKWSLTKVTVNGTAAADAKLGTAYEITIVEDGSVIGFTNTAKTGNVVITKTVNDQYDSKAAFTFHAINLTTGEDYGTKTLANGESWKIEGVEYGDQVQVTEAVDGTVYTTTVNGETAVSTVVEVAEGDNRAAFVNTRKLASLTVRKSLTDNGGEEIGSKFKFALEIQKDGAWATVEEFTLAAGEEKTIEGLYVGASYRVIETDSTAAFSFYGVTGGTTLEADGAMLTLADSNELEFVNDLNNAALTIRKTVEGGEAGDDTFEFVLEKNLAGDKWNVAEESIILSSENGYTWSKNDALVGDVYRITEKNLGSRYELTAVAGANNNGVDLEKAQAVVTMGADGNTVVFTNTVKTGEILVTKTLNDVIDTGAGFGFALYQVVGEEEIKVASFTLQNGQTWSSKDAGIAVRYGDKFIVRETCDEKTYETAITIDGAAAAADKVFTVTADETAVEFVNTRKTTDFELTKTVSGVTEQDEYFEIHMTGVFEDSNGETVTRTFVFNKTGEAAEAVDGVVYAKIGDTVDVKGVYYGVEYTIEEIGAEYYSCYINDIQTNKAVVRTDVTTRGDVSNVRKTADLTVTKALTRGLDLGEGFTFELYASIDGEWVQQGEAFELKVGETKTFEGLAIGLDYKVIETDTGDSYMFGSVDADSSLISTEDEKGASFTFTGDRNVTISNMIKTDSITVRKQILGQGGDMDTVFGFELLQLVNGEWVSVENFTLKANESKTFENLDLGETFKVIETDTGATFNFAGISIDNIGSKDKIDLNEQAATVVLDGAEDITFNNSPAIQKLTVEKKLTSGSADLGDKFGFHLYKEENGSWILDKTFYLKAGETVEFETINGEKYKVVEFETGNYYQISTILGADTVALAECEAVVTTDADKTVTFTNELLTGSVTINKYTSGLVSNNEEFDFKVTDDKGNAFANSALTAGQFSLNAGESITLNDIPYGTVITVTENVDGSRFLTMYRVSGDDVTYEGASTGAIVINKGSTVIDFTNQSKETGIDVESTVLGATDGNPPTVIDRTSGTVITGATGGVESVGKVSNSTYTIRTDVLGESDYAPETGDTEVPVSVIILMAVSGLMVLILSKRRRVTA